jgi:hypothetical protein
LRDRRRRRGAHRAVARGRILSLIPREARSLASACIGGDHAARGGELRFRASGGRAGERHCGKPRESCGAHRCPQRRRRGSSGVKEVSHDSRGTPLPPVPRVPVDRGQERAPSARPAGLHPGAASNEPDARARHARKSVGRRPSQWNPADGQDSGRS